VFAAFLANFALLKPEYYCGAGAFSGKIWAQNDTDRSKIGQA